MRIKDESDLYRKFKLTLIDLANLVTDLHVRNWHRGFDKHGTKRRRGNGAYSKCYCVNGDIRQIFMENAPKELTSGRR